MLYNNKILKEYFIKIENIISLFSYIIIIQFLTPYLLEVNYKVYFYHFIKNSK